MSPELEEELKNDLYVIREEIVKNLKILLCYPVEIVFWVVFPIFWVVPFIFQGEALVGGLNSESFANYAGTQEFIPYVLIGAILNTYVMSALYGMSSSLRLESFWGTLEYILGSPSKKISILLGKALSESFTATFFALSQTVISVILFGLEITFGKVLPILLVLILLILGLYGMAIGLAGLTLQIKETRSLIHTIENLFYLFSPVRYPTDINPITKMVSLIIPITYALIVVRGIMLLNESVFNLWKNVVILAFMDIFLIVFGYLTFHFIERRARMSGIVSHY
ncbi:MAG: ABC transporter permease [Candidatus Methanofastidiosia archaeon]